VPWQLTITSATGFGDEVVVRVSSEYFASFQYHGMSPEPVTQSSDGTYTYWTFAPPPGQQLVIEVNHTVKPSSWLPTDGQVAILIDGRPVATIDFSTLVFPWETIMEIIIRAVIVFFFLCAITRLVGRSTLGELSAFELILFLT